MVRVPDAVAKQGTRVPMVLVLHGGGGNAVNAEAMTGFTNKARQEGFIVVYPEGTSRGALGLLTWNASHCCGHAMQTRVDDVGFIGALIDRLVKDHPVDPKRIYATGLSNGGMMTHRLGIELSDRFAAIAPVIATLFGDETRPKRPVPALMINGLLDKSVPPDGGAPAAASPARGTAHRPGRHLTRRRSGLAPTAARRPRTRSKPLLPSCGATAVKAASRSRFTWSRTTATPGPAARPGTARGDTPTTALNATDVIWEFFKGHTR